jgi:EAL domain-containing protein (putative c-di-GMP-specific phosphodiesterase class I)
MLDDQHDLVIVRSTINMARNLGLNVVAEGAEDLATYNTLRGMGCDFVQGDYISKPLDVCQVDDVLNNGGFSVVSKFTAGSDTG